MSETRKLAAILVADVVGFHRLAALLLRSCYRPLEPALKNIMAMIRVAAASLALDQITPENVNQAN